MDLSIVVIITAFSLVNADLFLPALDQTPHPNVTNTSETTISRSGTKSDNVYEPPTTSTLSSSSSVNISGFLTVTWTKKCEGTLHLVPYPPSSSSFLSVCHSPHFNIQEIMKDVCQNKKGCEGVPSWKNTGRNMMECYNITEKIANKMFDSETVLITCKAEVLPDVQTQLQIFKVMTALLTCVLLVLFFIRFTKPTVTALQKRLSDRRQHRWIGPTQSHSVSYHRGKTAGENSEGEKRLSYPALERLTIGGSSSPSCSRNHFYDF